MSRTYPTALFRRPATRNVSQGDIAIAEFHQLRARSGDRLAPGSADYASERLPFLGQFSDHRVEVPVGDQVEERVLRVWTGYVMVLHQACEIDFADNNDSRLLIAPLVSESMWPEGPWSALRENLVPGYFYLPELSDVAARQLGLETGIPESVVAFASGALSSYGLIKPRRELALVPDLLPHLQDAMVRFSAVRGFNTFNNLDALKGKRVVDVRETDQKVRGPSRLIKVYLGDNYAQADDGDDEASVAYFGVRPE
jgi:hypothetical protein